MVEVVGIRFKSVGKIYYFSPNGIEFSKFSNTGYLTELEIDYVSDIEYIPGNNDPETNFKVVKDTTKPITSVRQFTLNCDDKIKTINPYVKKRNIPFNCA